MNIIKERDKRNIHRRNMKDQYDSVMTLSVTENEWVPLLQEGMITYGDGTPYFYIMRGVLRSYYENLPEAYEGSINIGHTDMASFPERIVGRWTKQNLRISDAGEGRSVLETNLPLNRSHPLVEALSEAEFDLGLSVEMSMEINEELTDNQELNPFGVPVVDKVFIYDYAIVGDAGDVNSMGIHLKGGATLAKNKLAELLSKEGGSNLSDITKLMDSVLSDAEVTSEEAESEETSEEEVEEIEEEEVSEEETEVTEEEIKDSEEEVELSEEEPEVSEEETELSATVSQMIDELIALRQENKELKAQIQKKLSEEKAFVDKFKQLSVSLTKETPKAEAPKSQYTDGIGE